MQAPSRDAARAGLLAALAAALLASTQAFAPSMQPRGLAVAARSSFAPKGHGRHGLLLRAPVLRRTASAPRVTAAMEGYTSMMTLDTPEAWAIFLFWSVPLPLVIGTLLRIAQGNSGDSGLPVQTSATKWEKGTGEPGIQRNLMWAFPSFACLLNSAESQPPLNMPLWQRWGLLLNSWVALGWYLFYKVQIEDELKEFTKEGLGGLAVVAPFALGFIGGLIGEYLYGSLEHEPFYDLCSSLFYGGFGWIYVQQFILYSKVNELYRKDNLTEPLLVWGLLVPGYNFVTGIRQIHFLSKYWAMKRGEEMQRDQFSELFPFATKETLGVIELFTKPELWVNWELMGFGSSSAAKEK
mmetsp:Transcript_57886/g.141976  ORF Transcript_57886/g.141976 Transcript_57886/m.141976 type:complete len:353 (-) Transcript_57886:718-1776(-)